MFGFGKKDTKRVLVTFHSDNVDNTRLGALKDKIKSLNMKSKTPIFALGLNSSLEIHMVNNGEKNVNIVVIRDDDLEDSSAQDFEDALNKESFNSIVLNIGTNESLNFHSTN